MTIDTQKFLQHAIELARELRPACQDAREASLTVMQCAHAELGLYPYHVHGRRMECVVRRGA